MRIKWFFIGSWIPITEGCFVQRLVKLARWFWRRRFLNFVNVLSLFSNYLPLEKVRALHSNKIESPLPKDRFLPSLVENGSVVLEKIATFVNLFYYFVIISPQRLSGLGEEGVLFRFINVFSLFGNYLLLKKSGALHLNKLKSSLPKDALCQVFFEISLMVLERGFFLFSWMFFFRYFVIISPRKKAGPLFEQNWIPFTQGYFVSNLFVISSVDLEKKIFLKFSQCIFAIS